jgi:hypothetical protein
MMSVIHRPSVERYVTQHGQIQAMLENLLEFVGTMPAPQDDCVIPGCDYGYIGDVGRIHELLREAVAITDQISGQSS